MQRIKNLDLVVALAAFAGLCIAVLTRAPQLLEPDDLAYRASIVALSHGHLTLSTAQYQALSRQVGQIAQWTQLSDGRWISEKNPGYPFFALPFQLLHVLRLTPLFYGALGCAGLYAGARRWLGRLGGAWAVVLYCSSGAALVFAWRATMPTFTDASLIAAGLGGLLWTLLAADAPARRRTVVGLLSFLALEGATFIRYTDIVALLVAVVAVPLVARRAGISRRALAWWGASVVAFGALVAGFDDLVYGGVLKTGYAAGEIEFGLGAVLPNLREMPRQLVSTMPLLVLALASLVWIGLRLAGSRSTDRRRDAAVAAGLAGVWLGVYALYLAYTWTVRAGAGSGNAVHVIRFYVPALGALALLAAWVVHRLPRWLPVATLAAVVAIGGFSYPGLTAQGLGPGLRGGGPAGGAPFRGAPGGVEPPGAGRGSFPSPGGAPSGTRPSRAP